MRTTLMLLSLMLVGCDETTIIYMYPPDAEVIKADAGLDAGSSVDAPLFVDARPDSNPPDASPPDAMPPDAMPACNPTFTMEMDLMVGFFQGENRQSCQQVSDSLGKPLICLHYVSGAADPPIGPGFPVACSSGYSCSNEVYTNTHVIFPYLPGGITEYAATAETTSGQLGDNEQVLISDANCNARSATKQVEFVY